MAGAAATCHSRESWGKKPLENCPHLSHPQGLFHLCVSPLASLSSSQYYLYCHCSGLWQTPTWLLYVPHIYVINKRMLASLTHS